MLTHTLYRQPAPLDYYDKVNIGDVGYIKEGQFHLLFNTGPQKDDERVIGQDVPEGFCPIEHLKGFPKEPRRPGAISTGSIKKLDGSVSVGVYVCRRTIHGISVTNRYCTI